MDTFEALDVFVDRQGYLRFSRDVKYVHRAIAEQVVLTRDLKSTEPVHHVDQDRSNPSPRNLVICPDQEYHMLLHARTKVAALGGDPNLDKWCWGCKKLHLKTEFSTNPSEYEGLAGTCREYSNKRRQGKGYSKFGWKRNLNQQYRRVKENSICVC